MAEIKPYTQQVLPNEFIGGRSATAADMGGLAAEGTAMIGDSLTGLSRNMFQLADQFQEQYKTEDTTAAYTAFAEKQAHWTQEYQTRLRTATPGDDTFAPRLMQDISVDLQKNGPQFKTKEGQALWQRMSTRMAGDFQEHAVMGQVHLAGEWAKVQNGQLTKALGSTAYNDPSQRDVLIAQANAAIDDPNSIYGKLDRASRDHFKAQAAAQINFAALSRTAQTQPMEVLQHISPELAAEFGQLNDKPAPNPTPSGVPKVSAGAAKWSSQVNTAAAASGVKANILLAQIDQESGGNPKAVNKGDVRVTGSPSSGIAQFQPGTAARYNVDVNDPVSSINGQAAYMADLLQMFGGDYQKALAGYNWGEGNVQKAVAKYGDGWMDHAPESTQNYIKNIYAKAGLDQKAIPVTGPGASAAQLYTENRAPAKVDGIPGFSDLTWEQQQHLVGTAQTTLRAQMTLDERKRMADQRAKADAQEVAMNDFTTRIFTPTQDKPWPTDDEITSNNTLDHKQKHELFNMMAARLREKTEGTENKVHPEAVMELDKRINAAEGSPLKIYDVGAINQAYYDGNISMKERDYLTKKVMDLKDPNGSSFAKAEYNFRTMAMEAFKKNLEVSIASQFDTENAMVGYARFMHDLDEASQTKRNNGESPWDILNPDHKDYFFKTHPMALYKGTFSNGMSAAVDNVKNGTAQPIIEQQAAKGPMPTYKEYDSLPSGTQFTDDKGNVRTKR